MGDGQPSARVAIVASCLCYVDGRGAYDGDSNGQDSRIHSSTARYTGTSISDRLFLTHDLIDAS